MPSTMIEIMPLKPTWLEIAICILLVIAAGGLTGLNREAGGHAAGFRTTILVGLAACEPGTDDSRSADTADCERQRMEALDTAAGRIAEAVRASRPRHTMRNATVLAIGGLAGFLLRGVLTGR